MPNIQDRLTACQLIKDGEPISSPSKSEFKSFVISKVCVNAEIINLKSVKFNDTDHVSKVLISISRKDEKNPNRNLLRIEMLIYCYTSVYPLGPSLEWCFKRWSILTQLMGRYLVSESQGWKFVIQRGWAQHSLECFCSLCTEDISDLSLLSLSHPF